MSMQTVVDALGKNPKAMARFYDNVNLCSLFSISFPLLYLPTMFSLSCLYQIECI